MEQNMLPCPRCGTQWAAGQRFCGTCGERLRSNGTYYSTKIDASQAQVTVRRCLESTYMKYLRNVEFTKCGYSHAGGQSFWDVEGFMLTKKKVRGKKELHFRFQVDPESGEIIGYDLSYYGGRPMPPSDKSSPELPSRYEGLLPSFEQLGRKHEPPFEEEVARRSRHLKTTGYLTLIVIFLLLLVGAEAGVGAYSYSQLQTGFQIQQCYPEIDVSAKPGVSAVNRITGLNVEGVALFRNPSFLPLYIPAVDYEVAIEGKKCPNVIQTRPMAVAPSSDVSQPISLQIDSCDLPELALHPLANGGTIHITIVSKLPLGAFSATKTTQAQVSVSKPLSSYVR